MKNHSLTHSSTEEHKPVATNSLTTHQLRLLTLAAKGMTYPEIAQSLGIDWKSVRNQLHKVRLKLGAKSTTQAVYIAFCDKSRQEEKDKQKLIEEIMDKVKELM